MTTLLIAALIALQPAKPAEYPKGEAMIARYFRHQVRQIADDCLTKVTTRDDWERKRPELYRQFMEMMGLWPIPEKTPLNARITGMADGDGFVVEKVVFESKPQLYVTGNLYRPKKIDDKLPAILYVCGHGNVVENGVSYGSKVYYQYHPAWFATHGYICLVIDTVELGEIPGDHHGTYSRGMWWWQSRGYTPAGVELWNAIRALDYLETRPDVDAKKLGVTGRSGGGATSWWLAAADERIQAAVPVAGIADLQSHLCEGPTERLKAGVITGHCDCMYMVNTYRWDFPMVAALIAPRPLLLGNSDDDDIFPVPGYRRIAAKVQKVYAIYGADEKFQLLETKGPHKDSPELRIGINQWMNRWLKSDMTTAVKDDLPEKLKPQQLKVLTELPKDARNTVIHETFVPREPKRLPLVKNEIDQIRTLSFSGWPQKPGPLNVKTETADWDDGKKLYVVHYTSEETIELQLHIVAPPGAKVIELYVADDSIWNEWCQTLGKNYPKPLQPLIGNFSAPLKSSVFPAKQGDVALGIIVPRGIGPTKWADAGTSIDIQMRRRFALIGQTLDGQRVWDVARGIEALRTIQTFVLIPILLAGRQTSAGIALMAGLFSPSVDQLFLKDYPADSRAGPTFLNFDKRYELLSLCTLFEKAITVELADKPQESYLKTLDGYRQAQKLKPLTIVMAEK